MYFCIKYHKEKESTYLYFIEKQIRMFYIIGIKKILFF